MHLQTKQRKGQNIVKDVFIRRSSTELHANFQRFFPKYAIMCHNSCDVCFKLKISKIKRFETLMVNLNENTANGGFIQS